MMAQQVSVTYWEAQMECLATGLGRSDPALAVTGISGVNQQKKILCLSHSVTLLFK